MKNNKGFFKQNNSRFCILIALFGYVFMFSQTVYGYDLQIDEMDVSMIVHEDNSYDITETLKVTFNRSDLHGIYRDIPLNTYFGKPVKITDVQVKGGPFTTEKTGSNLRVKIGDSNVTTRENQIYTIQYHYIIGDDYNETMDELYFNLVGVDWKIPILSVRFDIIMPYAFQEENVNVTYGESGSIESEMVSYHIDNNRIEGSLNQTLRPGEGLTIAIPLPEGYYDNVNKETLFMDLILPYLNVFIWLLFIVEVVLWFLYGKRKSLVPVISFYPPKGMSPIEMGYLYDGQVDTYDISAMLIYWADAGYIQFHEYEVTIGKVFKHIQKTIEIEKLRELPGNVPAYEKLYFNDLFNKYGQVNKVKLSDLTNSFYITLDKVKKVFLNSYNKDNLFNNVKTKKIKGWMVFGGNLIILITYIEAFHFINPYQIILGSVFALLFTVLTTLLALAGSKRFELLKTRFNREKPKYLLIGLFMMLLSMTIVIMMTLIWTINIVLLAQGIAGELILFLATYSKQYTELGQRYINELHGFKQFISHAEKDRIIMLVESNPSYYYHILPFAMALGVTDKWAKQFESITVCKPDWYNSTYYNQTFNLNAFTREITNYSKTIESAMKSSPSSGGDSSSGGSSGSGSGGGGGGGW